MEMYSININESKTEIFRVLTILFSKGYVFSDNRINTIGQFDRSYGGDSFSYWLYLVIGSERANGCKVQMHAFTSHQMGSTTVAVEDFVNKIHEKEI